MSHADTGEREAPLLPTVRKPCKKKEPVTLAAGTRIGHFTIERRLGSGGMGVVYLASDRNLRRKVAIKFIHLVRGGNESGRSKELVREARAAAALSHENVVRVHEVGLHEGEPYVAMEYLDGVTLRQWLAFCHRPWRDVLRIFALAGKGLYAAHDAGIVHRDFKPDNVMVAGHRVCVVDFGLASDARSTETVAGDSTATAAANSSPENMSLTGGLFGTPRYMSPEQRAGETIDSRSDQYSFCIALEVALKEAICDTRAGDADPTDKKTSRNVGNREAVPASLREVLRHGLSESPDHRYATMAELLRAIEPFLSPPRSRRPFGLALACLLLALLAGAAVFYTTNRRSAVAGCRNAAPRIAEVWNDRARDGLRGASAADSFGAREAERTITTLDDYTARWADAHTETCVATQIQHTQSEILFDLRMECLTRRLDEIRAAVSQLLDGNSRLAVRRARRVTMSLGPLSRCDDASALRAAIPLPTDRAERERIRRLNRRIQAIDALRNSGKYAEARDAALVVVEQARETNYAPILSTGLVVLAQSQRDAGETRAAIATLFETTKVAAFSADDRAAARAWSILIKLIGIDESTPSRAMELFPAAEAALLRAGSPRQLDVEMNYSIAQVLSSKNKTEEARARLNRAREMIERTLGPEATARETARLADILYELANLAIQTGDPKGAIKLLEQSLAIWTKVYGPMHPDVAFGHANLAEAYQALGKLEAARMHQEKTLEIRQASLGAMHPSVAHTLRALGWIQALLNNNVEALELTERALSISKKILPANSPEIANTLTNKASIVRSLGRSDEAEPIYSESIAILEAQAVSSVNLGLTYYNRGELALVRLNLAAALADFDRAMPVLEKHLGKTHAYLIYPLLGIGRARIGQREYSSAIAPLRRAVAMPQPGGQAREIDAARLYLGIALWHVGPDRRRARGMVHDARLLPTAWHRSPSSPRPMRS